MASGKMSSAETKAQWEMLKARRGLWLFPLLSGLLIAAATAFILMPMIQEILDIREENKGLEDKLSRLSAKLTQLNEIDQAELERSLVTATRALPNDKPIMPFLGLIELRTANNEIVVNSYALSPGGVASEGAQTVAAPQPTGEQPGTMAFMPIVTELSGTFNQVYAFLLSLKQAAPLTRLADMEITGLRKDWEMPAEASVGVKSELLVYYSLPPARVGALADPLPVFGETERKTLSDLEQLTTDMLEAVILPEIVQQRENPFVF